MKTKEIIAVIMVLAMVTLFASSLVEGVGDACMCWDEVAAEDKCVEYCTSHGTTCLIAYPYTGGTCYGLYCSRPYYAYCSDNTLRKFYSYVHCSQGCDIF